MSTKPAKTTTKHPYAAIEHRVIDSAAYADLSHSACRLLTILARQLSKDNNGNLQATYAYCQPRGIGSEHTLRDAIADLIVHGFIYRTRSHGANKAWARYAVTWLSIQKRDGLFLAGFVSCAWREWQPTDKKSSPQKVQDQSGKKCSFTIEKPAKSAGSRPAESADYEYVPIAGSLSPSNASIIPESAQPIPQPEIVDHADDFQRIREDGISADCWIDGECRRPVKKVRTTAPAIEQTRTQIAGLQNRPNETERTSN